MQLALQSCCVMLSNNAESLLSAPPDLSSGALPFTVDAQSIILTFVDSKPRSEVSKYAGMFLFCTPKRGLIVNDGCWGALRSSSSSAQDINII